MYGTARGPCRCCNNCRASCASFAPTRSLNSLPSGRLIVASNNFIMFPKCWSGRGELNSIYFCLEGRRVTTNTSSAYFLTQTIKFVNYIGPAKRNRTSITGLEVPGIIRYTIARLFGRDTGIRTPTSRIKICCATFTPYPNCLVNKRLSLPRPDNYSSAGVRH